MTNLRDSVSPKQFINNKLKMFYIHTHKHRQQDEVFGGRSAILQILNVLQRMFPGPIPDSGILFRSGSAPVLNTRV